MQLVHAFQRQAFQKWQKNKQVGKKMNVIYLYIIPAFSLFLTKKKKKKQQGPLNGILLEKVASYSFMSYIRNCVSCSETPHRYIVVYFVTWPHHLCHSNRRRGWCLHMGVCLCPYFHISDWSLVKLPNEREY